MKYSFPFPSALVLAALYASSPVMSQTPNATEGIESITGITNGIPYGANLSRLALKVTTDSSYNGDYTGAKARDGKISTTSKWASADSAQPHWMELDLGGARKITGFVVRHAGHAGEAYYFNTKRFRIQSRLNATDNWLDEAVVSNWDQSKDVHSLVLSAPKNLRYVRLFIDVNEAGPASDHVARIPEFEVWGLPQGVNWDVPFIHQVTDTAYAGFNGATASAPTAAVMVAAAFQRLQPWPFQLPGATTKTSDFGRYVSQDYLVQSVFRGLWSFAQIELDAAYREARGAYGACVRNFAASVSGLLDYLDFHDVGAAYDAAVSESKLRSNVTGGPILLGTYMRGSVVHVVIVKGLDDSGNFIVNDPMVGESMVYSWAQLKGSQNLTPAFMIACYGPQFVPAAKSNLVSVRSGSSNRGPVDVAFVDPNGTTTLRTTGTLEPSGTWTVAAPANFQGNVVLKPRVPQVAAMATAQGPELTQDPAFTLNGPMAEEAGARATPKAYAPAVYGNSYGSNTTLRIMNTGLKQASGVVVRFVGRPGYPSQERTKEIPAGGSVDITPAEAFGPSSWVGAVEVASPQPVAVSVTDAQASGASRTYGAAAEATPTQIEAPALYRDAWGLSSGLVVQNLGAKTTNLVVDFYDRSGEYRTSHTLNGVAPKSASGVFLPSVPSLPYGWAGTAKVRSSELQPIAAVVTSAKDGAGIAAYNARSTSASKYAVPRARKVTGGRTSSFLVRNTSESSVTFTARFYDEQGGLRTTLTYSCPPRGNIGQHLGSIGELPEGWAGSILIECPNPVLMVSTREDSPASISAGNAIAMP